MIRHDLTGVTRLGRLWHFEVINLLCLIKWVMVQMTYKPLWSADLTLIKQSKICYNKKKTKHKFDLPIIQMQITQGVKSTSIADARMLLFR